jgi:hypothetical protein
MVPTSDPEHLILIQIMVAVILGLGTIGGVVAGLLLNSLWKKVEEHDVKMEHLDKKKVNEEYCVTYHRAMEDKMKDGAKQFDDIDACMKSIEKTQTRLLRRQDRMTVCLGLIAQKYGVVMPKEEMDD